MSSKKIDDMVVIGSKEAVEKVQKKVMTKVEEKKKRISAYRRKVSRLASVANKRVERLEKNGLQNSPAYKGYLESGGQRFGVKGKSFNEVQAEAARLKAFIDAKTSTITGINNHLKEIADNTGIKYSDLSELREKADKFFELSSKVEQYLRTVEDMGSAIGYQKIWKAINVYVEDSRVDLASGEHSVEELTEQVSKALIEHQKPERIELSNDHVFANTEWFKLPKD